MIKKLLALLTLACGLCHAQSNTVFPAQTFTASGQSGSSIIQLNKASYSAGTVTVSGTSLTTVSFSVYGSSDNGNSYFALPITNVANPGAASVTTVTVTSAGLYQVNLLGITQVYLGTSGTFTATSVSLVFTASPLGNIVAKLAANTAPFTSAQIAPGWQLQTGSAGNSQPFFDDYYALGTYSTAGTAIGSASGGDNCVVATTTYVDANHPGNLTLNSGTGGSGTGFQCGPDNVLGTASLPATAVWNWESPVLVPVLPGTTAGTYYAGVSHTTGTATWSNVSGNFYLSSANGTPNNWYCGIGGTASYTNSGVAATAVTWTRLTITSDGTNVRWYINGSLVCGPTAAFNNAQLVSPTQYAVIAGTSTSLAFAVDYGYFYHALTR